MISVSSVQEYHTSTNMQYVLTFIGLMAIYFIFRLIKARIINKTSAEMYKALVDDNIVEFDRLCNKKTTKFLIPPFNVVYSQFNFNTLNDHEEQARKLVDYVCPLKINAKEKMALFNLALPYFLDKQDKEYVAMISKGIRELLSRKDDDQSKLILRELDLLLDIYMNANIEREPELKALIEETSGEVANIHKQRLAILYMNTHRTEEAKTLLDEVIAETQNELMKKKMQEKRALLK